MPVPRPRPGDQRIFQTAEEWQAAFPAPSKELYEYHLECSADSVCWGYLDANVARGTPM